LDVLLPLKAWWDDPTWRHGLPLAFLALGIAPFLLVHLLSDTTDVAATASSYALYFAVVWLLVLRALIRPERMPWPMLVGVAVFTGTLGVTLAIVLDRVLGTNGGLIQNIIGIGLPEELVKALPLLIIFVAFSRRHALTPRGYIYLGVISGLLFGAFEAIGYSVIYEEYAPSISAGSFINGEVWRLVADSLLHACMAGIAAYFIGLASRRSHFRWYAVSIGIGLAAVLHGLYDTYAGVWSGAFVAALILFVFLGYVRTGDTIAEQVLGVERERT
jgi:RsiW-degrading membrane proteinase PrsW (M82 family)